MLSQLHISIMKNHSSYQQLRQDPFPIKQLKDYHCYALLYGQAQFRDDEGNIIVILLKQKIIKFYIINSDSEKEDYIEIYSRPINRHNPIEEEIYTFSKQNDDVCILI